jgi:hypothetical protein
MKSGGHVLHHNAEAKLAALLAVHAQAKAWEHRHPLAAVRAWLLLRFIALEHYAPSTTLEGQIIRGYLRRSHAGVTTPLHQAATVLELPEEPGRYNQGRDRATQRRQARKAAKLGVTWNVVDDAEEKARLLDIAVSYERAHPQSEYRETAPDLRGLLDIELWLVAHHDGRPLLLSVTAVDGEWALLRYFRTLQSGEVSSAARYLMTGVLAEELVSRGVRYLSDTRTPFRLNSGLRQFSRMVGFRTRRVRVE